MSNQMLASDPVRALVLSGGGGRGAYHVGVLRFLEEHEWISDVLHREIELPIIVSPQRPIPLVDIIRYSPENHERLYRIGYEDARAAWMQAGRAVERQTGG